MDWLVDLFYGNALADWISLGVLFLIVELATGSGWLLWPAGSAVAVGLASLAPGMGLAGETLLFALLTIATTYVGRRFINHDGPHRHDPNDTQSRLIGRQGLAASVFEAGRGRVFVDGKEWSAELDDERPVVPGVRVHVVALVGGACLKVRAD